MSRLPPPPALPSAPHTPPFPLIAVLAPLGGAIVIGALTGSPYVLVFAVLSPVIAVASMLDGRRTSRRQARADSVRFDDECRAYARLIDEAQGEERAEQDARTPARPTARSAQNLPPEREEAPVRVGVAQSLSSRAPEATMGPDVMAPSSPEGERREALLTRARWHPELPVVVPRGTIALRGTSTAARAMEARLRLEPGVTVVVDSEDEQGSGAQSPAAVLEVHSASSMTILLPGRPPLRGRPEFWSAPERTRHLSALEVRAVSVPDRVSWSEVSEECAKDAGVTIGVGESGPLAIHPEAEGPHLLVGGTTGSGKSEFLRALVLGWASRSSPAELALLFVDFKGGASFLDLETLPHALEVITDLDATTAARAISSLRAEIQRRERWLRDRGARDIGQPGASLGRLVVVIDEYAALLATLPELHGTIIDIAARGRSLGIHLVLCTQHPGSVVRDAIAANCAIRVSFRVAEDADAGLLGAGLAARLRGLPPGRALVSDARGLREVQTALIEESDVVSVRERWSAAPRAVRPWIPPLPTIVTPADLDNERVADSEPAQGWAFGLTDRPDLQRRTLAVWNPERDGSLAVIGAPGSGRTGGLAALAAAAQRSGAALVMLAPEWPDAAATLGELARETPSQTLLLADDIDELARCAADERTELLRLWDAATSALRRRGGAAAASLGAGPMQQGIVGGRFSCVIELRGAELERAQPGRSSLASDEREPAGRGRWRGSVVQLASVPPLPKPRPPRIPEVVVDDSRSIVVVARHPRRVAQRLARSHPRAVVLSAPECSGADAATVALDPRIVLDDVEGWTAQWSALQSLRRACPVILVGVAAPELRSLLGVRESPPPLRLDRDEVWLLEPEAPLVRARWSALADDEHGEG